MQFTGHNFTPDFLFKNAETSVALFKSLLDAFSSPQLDTFYTSIRTTLIRQTVISLNMS